MTKRVLKLLALCLAGVSCFIAAPQPAQAEPGLVLESPLPGAVVREFDQGIGRYSAGHRGVDLAASPGETVRAAAIGRVYFSGMVAGRPSISIDHGNGLRTTYTPVQSSLQVGDAIEAGQPIGIVGSQTHCAHGCLHWGLTDGLDYFDPLAYLKIPRIRLLPLAWQPTTRREFPAATLPGTGKLPVEGVITSRFGMRMHPILRIYKLHDGLDLAASCGTPVNTPWAGTVVSAGLAGGYGNRVIVQHEGKRTLYAHLQGFSVKAGDQLAAGAIIGQVGTTGLSTGCHLHWITWQAGNLVDPLTLVPG